jgi:hypothetical protein
VLRSTMLKGRSAGRALSALPICSATPSTARKSGLPRAPVGVPTVTMTTSLSVIASAASVVALSRPLSRPSVISSGKPGSTKLGLPRFNNSTLPASTSTPNT